MELLNKIDWKLLREQKQELVGNMLCPSYPELQELMDGLVNLIDGLQDEAVDSGRFSEEEVFGHEDINEA